MSSPEYEYKGGHVRTLLEADVVTVTRLGRCTLYMESNPVRWGWIPWAFKTKGIHIWLLRKDINQWYCNHRASLLSTMLQTANKKCNFKNACNVHHASGTSWYIHNSYCRFIPISTLSSQTVQCIMQKFVIHNLKFQYENKGKGLLNHLHATLLKLIQVIGIRWRKNLPHDFVDPVAFWS